MAPLVSLADAKSHLHIPDSYTDRDADVLLKAEQASAIVVDYLKTDTAMTWTSSTVPGPVQAAVLLMLGHLYENRGDDMKADEGVWSAVSRYCMRFRDPALA